MVLGFLHASGAALIAAIVISTKVGWASGEIGSYLDPSSYSNVDQFQPSHISFALDINFEASAVDGTVTHTLTALDMNASTVYLDVWDGIEVYSAQFMTDGTIDSCPSNWTTIPFNISTPNPNIGNALRVELPCTMTPGREFWLKFDYSTNADSYAVSWLTPAQTAGKELPYMYSLCQMNYCRDFAPMMDTPSMKITYDATVIAPKEFVVRMSANTTSETEYNATHTVSVFDAAIKIPSYLIAIVVGQLETRMLNDRVSVISEPAYLDMAVEEFAELPQVLDIVEEYLMIPYIWGSYAIVIMPPSFPWGGMEHPLITFATPTLLTGDKSMVDVAIHEMTHSWFGNDVGCQSWEHFWINEGMNTFMERKVLSILRSPDFAKVEYFKGNTSMYFEDMLYYGLTDSYSSLNPQIGDDDPENSFGSVPYEKGSQFVYYIESLVGEDMMKMLLREYLTTFAQMAINQTTFKAMYEGFIFTNFNSTSADEIIALTNWDTWVTVPGLPPIMQDFSTKELDNAEGLANEYLALGGQSSPENYTDYFLFSTTLQSSFIQVLQNANETTLELLALVDADLNLTASVNPDLKTLWYQIGIAHGYEAVMEPCRAWMSEQGRNYYVRYTFRALVDAGMCEIATSWFAENEAFYNSYVVGNVAGELTSCDEAIVETTSFPSSSPNFAEPVIPSNEQPASRGGSYNRAARIVAAASIAIGMISVH